jgi:uncharacterized protein
LPTPKPLHRFSFYSTYPDTTAAELFTWHSREGALERLLPPWEKTTVLFRRGGIAPGAEVGLRMHLGPIPFGFHARHIAWRPGEMFADTQERGPFASWTHRHFFDDYPEGAQLHDQIDYALPGHSFLPAWASRFAERGLRRLFRHRQAVLTADLDLHRRCSLTPLRILISGASGVLGRALRPLLTTGGHRVHTLVRRPVTAANEIFWDPQAGRLRPEDLPELDAVIHLAGEYIGLSRWNEGQKQRVLSSRIDGTALLARTLAAVKIPPKVLLSASATGYYGDTGSREIDESCPAGTDFISEVCRHWEEAAAPAQAAGIRTVVMRLGVGLTPQGGGLQRILATAPLGFIRRFGSGSQYISWISSDDMVAAMLHCLTCPKIAGPVNIVAPEPLTNAGFMTTLARLTGRPLLPPVPAEFLRLLYGQMASEIVLSGCRASPRKLLESGFTFRHPTLESALRYLLGLHREEMRHLKRNPK